MLVKIERSLSLEKEVHSNILSYSVGIYTKAEAPHVSGDSCHLCPQSDIHHASSTRALSTRTPSQDQDEISTLKTFFANHFQWASVFFTEFCQIYFN